MRFLSIAAFAGLLAAAHVSADTLEARSNCAPGLGKGPSGGSCKTCDVNTFSTGGKNAVCDSCPSGSGTPGTGSYYCTCSTGYYSATGLSFGDACSACIAGYSSASGSKFCTPCPDNTYSGAGGVCTACPTGTWSSSGASYCSSLLCAAGKYASGTSCVNCPAGSYSSKGATQCNDCPAGMVSNAGSSTCTICPGGSVPGNNGKTCKTCPRDTYSSGDQCTACPAGYTSSPGSSACGPQPSKRAVQPVLDSCSLPGYERCAILSGMGGSECINVLTTLDSCGGCVGPEGADDTYTGQDCSAIPHVDQVKCEQGQCQVKSCRSGYTVEKGECVPAHGAANVRRTRAAHPRHDFF